jgi:F-type H+-transporting ATPase subunit b
MSERMFPGRTGLLLLFALILCFVLAGPAAVLAAEQAGGKSGEAVAGSHEGGGAAGESHGISPAKIKDLIYRVMNFVAAVLILYFILRKPIRQFFSSRRQEIENTLKDLEQKKIEGEARVRELEAKLAGIQSEREAILAEYVREGEAEKAKIIDQAQAMSARIQQQAQVAVRQEIDKAKQDLKREIAEMSTAMAEELVRKNINAQDQDRLVAEYLEKVVQS